MSRLMVESFGGNLFAAAAAINKMGLADSVLTMDYSGGNTVAVFRATDYPNYVHLCKKFKREPITTAEYFK